MCHTSPSVADFELCKPEKKNYPLLKTLVSRLTSRRSQAGNLSSGDPASGQVSPARSPLEQYVLTSQMQHVDASIYERGPPERIITLSGASQDSIEIITLDDEDNKDDSS